MIAKFFQFAFIAATALVSCSDNEQQEEPIQTFNKVPVDTVAVKKTVPDSLIIKSILEPQASAKGLPGLPADAPQSSSLVVPATSNARLNPAHGQPGHRCDIAVGAALDSKPLPNNTTPVKAPVITAPALPATTAQPVAQKVTPGMNPAHGQPGHRCDIAVGAPLNSKPATSKTTPAVAKTQVPAAVTAPPPVQKVAPGMNPSHGQPGHRCDIAVGAPLDSKPTVPAAKPANPEPAKTDSTKK